MALCYCKNLKWIEKSTISRMNRCDCHYLSERPSQNKSVGDTV